MQMEKEYNKFKELLPQYNFSDKQQEFMKDMFKLVTTDRDTGKITCIPAMCGTGKSVFINTFIKYVICNNRSDNVPTGLIVVTDSLKRLDDLARIGDQEGRKQIFSLKSDESFIEQLKRQHYKPILCMTTQRFFLLNDTIRSQLFNFSWNDNAYKRNIIIFDEKPYFSAAITLDIKNLTRIEAALYNGLHNEVEDKGFIISEFKSLKERIIYAMDSMESLDSKDNVTLYWKDNHYRTLTRDDDLFFRVINDNLEALTKQYPSVYVDLIHLLQLVSEGGVFNSVKKKNGNYEKSFTILVDNTETFCLGQDKKFFVFDATADIDPCYKRAYVNMIDCSKYRHEINLDIINVSIPTSKNALCRSSIKAKTSIEAIIDYAKRMTKEHDLQEDEILFVTYSDLVRKIEKDFNMTGYFGNLKGFNQYRNMHNMFHIGMNRFPNLQYFYIYCGCHMDVYRKLSQMKKQESMIFFEELTRNQNEEFKEAINDIMVKSMLADFEQNIYRISIREPHTNDKVRIWTFYNNNDLIYHRLSESIERRYHDCGANFIYKDSPIELSIAQTKNRKAPQGKEKTNSQRLIEWFQVQEDGRIFKIKDIVSETTGLNEESIKELRKSNSSVKRMFTRMQTAAGKRGYYKIEKSA